MPIEYRIDRELRVVHHGFTGEIHLQDLEQHWRPFLSDPDLPDPLLMFADMRGCRIMVHGDDALYLVRRVIEPMLGTRRWVSAVAVSSSCDYGVTKQFIAYSDPFGETEVFMDARDAWRWLTARLEAQRSMQVDRTQRSGFTPVCVLVSAVGLALGSSQLIDALGLL